MNQPTRGQNQVICIRPLRVIDGAQQAAAGAAARNVPSLQSVLATAPGQQPHNNEDDGRDHGSDHERLEH